MADQVVVQEKTFISEVGSKQEMINALDKAIGSEWQNIVTVVLRGDHIIVERIVRQIR